MNWIALSIITALFESLKDVVGKKSLKDMDEYLVSWALRFYSLLFILPFLFFSGPFSPTSSFWWALFTGGLLNVLATVFYMKAIKYSPISISVPMVTFTPVFLLITSPIILGEFPPLKGVLGVFIVVVGAYLLQIKEMSKGILAPIKAIYTQKGPRFMLMVAVIWSITANIDKVGIGGASVIHWAVGVHLVAVVALLPLIRFRSGEGFKGMSGGSRQKLLFTLGLVNAVKILAQMWAIQLALVAYVISIKRTSAVITVVLGCLIFKEKGLKQRLLGASLMVVGVLLITL